MRRPRIHYPGAAYHAMARGVDGRAIYADDSDRRIFLAALREVGAEQKCSVLAYCLMGNHFHLAIKVGAAPLCGLIQRMLTKYVVTFNARHGRTGHLFQARYKAVLCLEESYLASLIPYIHQNPVRAGLVSAAEEWPWSSAAAYRRGTSDGVIDVSALRRPLAEEAPADFDAWAQPAAPVLMRRAPACGRESLASIALKVCREQAVPAEVIQSRTKDRRVVNVKRLIIRACRENGHTSLAIAEWLGCTNSAVAYLLRI